MLVCRRCFRDCGQGRPLAGGGLARDGKQDETRRMRGQAGYILYSCLLMFTAPPPAFAINGILWTSQSGTFLCLNTKPVKFQTTAMIFFFYYHKTMKWGFSLFSMSQITLLTYKNLLMCMFCPTQSNLTQCWPHSISQCVSTVGDGLPLVHLFKKHILSTFNVSEPVLCEVLEIQW